MGNTKKGFQNLLVLMSGSHKTSARCGIAIILQVVALALISGASKADPPHDSNPVASAIDSENHTYAAPTKVYEARITDSKSHPGNLVASEEAHDYQLPAGVSAKRFAYVTLSPDNRPVVATAVVVVPSGTAPGMGWPVIAWAHGTTGIAQPCAPSRTRNLEYGWDELYNLVGLGYAVVSTDYQGMGTQEVHPWLDKISNADDVRFSVLAARSVVPNLGRAWIAMGHSQGALAAIGVDEQERTARDPGYLGSVAVAFGDPAPTFERLAGRAQDADVQPFYDAYMAFLAHAVHAIHPSFESSEILTASALKRAQQAQGHCQDVYAAAFSGLKVPAAVDNWERNKDTRAFFDRVKPTGDIAKPILMVASDDDEAVAIASVDEAVRRLCDKGAPVTYIRYAGVGLDHIGVLHSSFGLRLHWIQELFKGSAMEESCPAVAP